MCEANLPLDASYLAKIDPKQLQALQEQGQYVGNPEYFSESCFVKAAATAQTQNVTSVGAGQKTHEAAQVTDKGLGVEHGKNSKPGVSTTETVQFNLDAYMKEAGFDPSKKEALTKALIEGGVTVDKNGTVTYDKAKFEIATAKFAKDNRMTAITIDGDNDGAIASDLEKQRAIVKDANGRYIVQNKEAVDKAFPKQDEKPTKAVEQKTIKLNAQVTTSTVDTTPSVQIADDLKNNRAGRKETEKNFQARLEEWTKDPENKSTMDYQIAKYQYEKQVIKQVKNIAEKECNNNAYEILEKYFEKGYATEKEKENIKEQLNNIDEQKLLEQYKKITNGEEFDTSNQRLASRQKIIAKYSLIAEDKNFDPSVLVERMAVKDVLKKRDDKDVEKDRQKFIKEEAKRQTEAAQTKQNIENTRIYFSKEDRKAAEKAETNPAIEHNDLGKAGRKLVMECPDVFCDEVEAGKGDFEVNGRSYKFNQEKFKNFCSDITDSRKDDEQSQQKLGKDNNLTLKEGRDAWMNKQIMTKDGQLRSLELILGNNNNKVGNGELNKLRHLVEKSGHSVDRNKTNLKRALHVVKSTVIGGVIGAATAGLGNLASGALSVTAALASQKFGYSGKTADRVINDSTTFTYNDGGETFTQKVNKKITVNGQEYSGEVEVPGKEVSKKSNQYLESAKNGGILGSAGGALAGLLGMGKVHAKGNLYDGIVNLDKKTPKQEQSEKPVTINIQRCITTEQRSVTKEEPPKQIENFSYRIKVSHPKGTNYNLAEDRLSIVKKMYGIEDNAKAEKVLNYIMTKINGYKQNPYKTNYAANLTYYFPSEIPANSIDGIDEDINGQDPNKLGGFERNKIILGGKNGNNANASNLHKPGAKRSVRAKLITE